MYICNIIRNRLTNLSGIITDGPGNYSENNQCSWLIDPSSTNTTPLRLYLNHFATECSWDHLYIYDGGSIYDPLLAVFRYVVSFISLSFYCSRSTLTTLKYITNFSNSD